jgi:4'-phosphopantetheinyl transferase
MISVNARITVRVATPGVQSLIGFLVVTPQIEDFFAPPAKVHVWWISTTLQSAGDCLSPKELLVASRFHFDRDRIRYRSSHSQLRQLLSRYLGERPWALQFGHGPQGKPFVEAATKPITFNLSHSGNFALVAVANGCDVGVDVEIVRTDPTLSQVADRFFTPGEARWLATQDPTGFFRLWTLKEACIKAAGGGLSIPLNQFEIRVAQKTATLGTLDPALAGPWDIRELPAPDGYAAAVAIRGTSSDLSVFPL